MICIDNQHRILPQIIAIHGIKDLSEIEIAHAYKRFIVVDAALLFLFCFFHFMIARPVIFPSAVIRILVHVFFFFLYKKGLMRVKGLDMKEPVIFTMIAFDEFKPVFEGYSLRHIIFTGHQLPVDHIPVISRP